MSDSPSSLRAERILRAARRQFETSGFRRTSMADVAHEAGVAAGTIYWRYKSKEELFLHLIDQDNAEWLERARDALADSGTALERLARLAGASADFYGRSRLLLAALRRDERLIQPPLLEDIHSRLAKQSISLMAEVIQDGIEEGSIRPVDPEKVAAVLFAAGHALFGQTDHPYQELSDVLSDVAIRGLEVHAKPRSGKRTKRRSP